MATQKKIKIITLNNPPLNSLNNSLRLKTFQNIKEAIEDFNVEVILICGANSNFSAGADISEFKTGSHLKDPLLPDLIDLIEQCTKPVIAAIEGNALGGGLEVCLGCHWRIAHSNAKFGLPEVNVGLIPGAGGTQRLPRLVGISEAMPIMLTGISINSLKAKEIELIDEIVDCPINQFLDNVIQWILNFNFKQINLDNRRLCNKPLVDDSDGAIFEFLKQEVSKRASKMIAPIECILAVQAGTKNITFKEAIKIEQQKCLNLINLPETKALQYVFFSKRLASKLPEQLQQSNLLIQSNSNSIKIIGIVGAGTMGRTIALTFLNYDYQVIIIDKQQILSTAKKFIDKFYSSEQMKGKIDQIKADSRINSINYSIDLSNLNKADLVIEAIFENLNIKLELFRNLDKICKPTTILCSNTSTLNIEKMGLVTNRPNQVLGLHFFNPAHVMQLVEIIVTPFNDINSIQLCSNLTKQINKTSVFAKNAFGFIGNRMLSKYLNEAILIFLKYKINPKVIDKALTDFGFPMGPFQISDLIGNDISIQVASEQLSESTSDLLKSPNNLLKANFIKSLCAAGRLGQKTGKGWYKYEANSRIPIEDPEIYSFFESNELNSQTRHLDNLQITQRCILSLINEAFILLEEGIAFRPSDIDIVWVYGYGWPPTLGGPIYYANQIGLKEIQNQINQLIEFDSITDFKIANLINNLVNENRSIYDYNNFKKSIQSKL
eukprot:TRINITY_DN2776_c0_g2_i2.p1 TRINITY_DN2776_c0_g2~~TRINITY_DN2776_c0_g2_i2.p1  ORF type:complete len:721 (+),score=323.40 TRINITY_DN2776_c0_g2_i2:1157-3319(+)